LAKEYEVPSEVLVRLLQKAGVEVRSHLSSVDKESFLKVEPEVLKEKEKLSKKKSPGLKKNTKANVAFSGSSSKSPLPFAAKVVVKKTKKSDDSDDSVKSKLKVTLKKTTKEEADAKSKANPVSSVKSEPSKSVHRSVSENAKVEAKLAKKESPFIADDKKTASKSSEVKAKVQAPVPPKTDSEVNTTESKNPDVKDKTLKSAAEDSKLKVKVEKPTDEMAARIARYAADQKNRQQANRRGGSGQRGGRGGNDSGYTGKFSKSVSDNHRGPGGPGGGNRGPGGPGGGNRGPGGPGGGNRGPGGPGGGNRGPGGPGGNRGPGGPGAGNRGPGANRRPSQGSGQGAMAAAFKESNTGAPAGNRGPGVGAPPPGMIPPPGQTGNHGKGNNKKGKKGKSKATKVIAERTFESKTSVNKVMASLSKNPSKKVYKKEIKEDESGEERQVLQVSDFVTVSELAGLMKALPARVIAKCMEMGMMVTINYRLEFETIQLLADEFGFEAELMEEYEEDQFEDQIEETTGELTPRAPVVTVMGHVDHGKTSLLDWIRKEKVAAGEAGGITQHVGAYSVSTEKGAVTFLDTPGHEAFTAMRARGSQVTDVVVLVVAADDRVMPQTVESIEHARAAKVPVVVAITKCDLETANTDKIRAQLAERGIEVEQWGGSTSCVDVSSKTGLGMETLLETLALETEVLDLKADKSGNAKGTVIESKVEKGRGSVATVLIQSGTLKVGDNFVTGIWAGRVRAILNESGEAIQECEPGYPCQIMGMDGAPMSGDKLIVTEDDKASKEIAGKRRMAAKERELRARQHMTLDQLYDRVKAGSYTQLNLIIKADTNGSAEAIAAELEKLGNKEVGINIVRKAVGNLNESDVMLASASDAIIIAFHILPNIAIRDLADKEGVEIKHARIIYHLVEEFESVVEGMLKPTIKEEVAGEAEIKQLFKVPKAGVIAGSVVTNGTVDINSKLRIYRKGMEIGKGNVTSLRRHQDEVEAVKAGFECGIGISGIETLEAGDTLAFFREVQIKRSLKDVEK
jgi:translation initiation factor IF-2